MEGASSGVGLQWSEDGMGIRITNEQLLGAVLPADQFRRMLEVDYGFRRDVEDTNCYRHPVSGCGNRNAN